LNELCWPLGLSPSDLERLQAIVRHIGPLPVGSYLFRSGDPFIAIYAVRSGCIKSHSFDANGHELVHGFHLRGELLGFDAVYPDHHRCNALVLESSSLCVMPYRDITLLSEEFPSLRDPLLRLVGRELSKQLMCAEYPSATQKIANFLLDIRARLHRAGKADDQFALPMAREDIANYLGITPETVSRVLAKLQQGGLIEANRRSIFLTDPARLGLTAQGTN
jgi:CRP/FNR family transcriptional regulator